MFRIFSRKQLQRVKHAWGAGTIWGGKDISHWLQHPLVQERINLKVSGTPGVNRFEYFLNRHLKGKMPVERALTLGSGVGELERGLCHYNFARSHEGIDLSDDAIQTAIEKAAEIGLTHLHYRMDNLNTIVLEPKTYDVIFGISSIHHVQELEHLFDQVRQALKPGGFFFLDEFIGPNRFQWPDGQRRVMNEQLSRLPKHLRRSILNNQEFKFQVARKSLDEVLLADPSEAIRSSEIVPLLSRFFNVLEVRGYGGSVIHELLYDIAGNFCEENPGSLDHLRRLFEEEDDLIARGELGHDFAVIIATSAGH
jgi:2-polyprenyl-3-methyl-5-hydroxy-6-metoxy-1,4-benzoquinol methylase